MDHNILTQPNLEERLIDYLKAFNDEKAELSPDTVHSEVLSTTDGLKNIASSKMQYENAVRYSIARGLMKEGMKKKEAEKAVSKIKLMSGWMNASVRQVVADLVSKLPILLFLLLISLGSSAQLQFNAGLGRTALGKAGVTLGLHYFRSLDTTFQDRDIFKANTRSSFQLSPEFHIEGGTEDAFESIQAKMVGSIFTFQTNEVGGIPGIDFNKFHNVFPIAAGVETNGNFSILNAIVEVGWVPVYWTETQKTSDWLKRTRVGMFLQAGRKLKRDTAGLQGGERDMSEEDVRKNILRFKGSVQASIIKPVQISSFRVGLTGSADYWYDITNGATYYQIDADLRFFVSGDNYVSFFYKKGAGEPTYNSGSTWGVGLNITY